MARETVEAWIPVEYASTVIQRPDVLSAIESTLSGIPMSSTTKSVPRSGAASVAIVAKGSAYGEDAGVNDSVILVARKPGTAFRFAEEDLNDSISPLIEIKKAEFARSYSKFFDNACIGCSGVENGTTIPYTSIYKAVRSADAATGYVADANYVASAAAAPVSYDNLSQTLALVEGSDWYDPGSMVVYAAPQFKSGLRGIKDTQGRPIFVSGLAGTPDTIFDMPIKWTQGARATAVAQYQPVGNPLMVFANPDYLMRGDRSGPEAKVDTSVGTLTDEVIMVMRCRKAFKVAVPSACAVLEDIP